MQNMKYENFTAKEITPAGWLYDQLKIQAGGLAGNLDKIWPDVRDSGWIGLERDSWERVPYWLDGFVPLAYLLRDEDMIKRAKRYVDAILERQKPDGWICPCEDGARKTYDAWAIFQICKVLALYADCSGDERVEGAVSAALKNLMHHIRGNSIFNWGASRWFECIIPIYWLWKRTKEDWLIYLALALRAQGISWRDIFSDWKDREPHDFWSYQTHGVNLATALKCEALVSLFTDSASDGIAFSKQMYETLMKYHGTAIGHFNGDECLAGGSPIHGAELCLIVEAMYSFEVLFGISGDPYFADRLEEHAFNSLPATISPDMWTHQYDQLVNQAYCTKFKDKPIFYTNSGEAHLFGLEPNFGCCTANMGQGWPKFALSAFCRKGDDHIASVALAPAALSTNVNGSVVKISLDTLYPFRSRLPYTVEVEKDTEVPFAIRIPGFAKSAKVNGEPVKTGAMHEIRKVWGGKTQIEAEFEFEAEFIKRQSGMVALRRGPLFYSVAIGEKWRRLEYSRDGVNRFYPYCDYEIEPVSKWNYAFTSEKVEVVENDGFDRPFSSEAPPIKIIAEMAEIDWGFEPGYDNLCAEKPKSRMPLGKPQKVTLHPYGATNLRMTEVPLIKQTMSTT